MSKDEMPLELRELEDRWRRRTGVPPVSQTGKMPVLHSELRGRVLRAVEDELANPGAPQPKTAWRISHVAAAAAIVLIVLNLAVISASVTDFVPAPAPHFDRRQAIEAQVLELGIASPEEARRIAVVMTGAF